MKIRAMIHHFHGGTSLVTVPEGRDVRQALDDIWTALNVETPDKGDFIVNSGQPGDLISIVGYCPFGARHAVCESVGFTTFMTTEFAVRHVADRTSVVDGVRIYDPECRFAAQSEPDVFDPSEALHLTGDESDPHPNCDCCGHRPASVHEASASFCPTCYEAGAGRDDRDQS